MTKKNKNPCLFCGCWDSDAQGCTMPHSDKWYACPIDCERPENKREFEKTMADNAEKTMIEYIESDEELLIDKKLFEKFNKEIERK